MARAFGRWSARVVTFIDTTLGPEEAGRFNKLAAHDWPETLALRLGHLEGLLVAAAAPAPPPFADSVPLPPSHTTPAPVTGRRVFVVHGHDSEAKEAAARFLTKIGLEPIILHEQASSGRTVIEKFETYSEGVAFAIVLLTPDDVGAARAEAQNLRARARQNVIMKLGYFIGKLGRTRVCALHRGNVELPSDYQGVLYIELDSAGAWRTKVAQELVQSKVPIELAGLLGA